MNELDSQLPAVVKQGIDAHLERVDLYLKRSGKEHAERQAIVIALRDQIEAMLERRSGSQPTGEDLQSVLRELEPPKAFDDSEIGTGHLLRVLWRRLCFGIIVPLAENDRGRRHVYWRRLVFFGLFVYATSISIVSLFTWLLGLDFWRYGFIGVVSGSVTLISGIVRLYRMPVSTLPPKRS